MKILFASSSRWLVLNLMKKTTNPNLYSWFPGFVSLLPRSPFLFALTNGVTTRGFMIKPFMPRWDKELRVTGDCWSALSTVMIKSQQQKKLKQLQVSSFPLLHGETTKATIMDKSRCNDQPLCFSIERCYCKLIPTLISGTGVLKDYCPRL